MICLKRNQINDVLWNKAVENSSNPRIYALTWYLDSVCDEWWGITNKHYEWVFPVPIAKKWGIIPWIAQPPFCQQLGCFSYFNIDLESIIKKIRFYPKIMLNFHSQSNYSLPIVKKNSLLKLDIPYENIHKNYSNLRKRELKKIQTHHYSIKINENIEKSLAFWIQEWKKKDFYQEKWYNILNRLIVNALKNNRLHFLSIYDENNRIIGVSLFLIDFQRITYLGGTSTQKGVNTFMFDFTIRQFASKVKYLDFEGSSIPSIQKFYESWGNLEFEDYFVFKKIFMFYNC